MIEIDSLSKSYGSLAVLKNISLTLDQDQVHGVVGRNGAGKTTFFNCLVGIESYTGTISYSGNNLREESAYLPTRPYMMSHITGHEYLRLIANARHIQTIDPEVRDLFELPLDRYASTYSTGMQKKLALTGLLLQKSEVFLLDEPFNGVDMESNLLIQSLIERLRSLTKTIVISSHIFQTLEKSCDVIHHLEDGHIIKSYLKNELHLLEKELSTAGESAGISTLDL